MHNHTTPTPQDFCDRALFRAGGPQGIECLLGGVLYDVASYTDHNVQVLTKDTGDVVAILGFDDGKFVVPGR